MLVFGLLIAGSCVGVLTASARVPHVRVLPSVICFALAIGTVVALMGAGRSDAVTILAFLGGMFVSSSLYSGLIWVRIFPEGQRTLLQFAVLDFVNPPVLRREYASRFEPADSSTNNRQPVSDQTDVESLS